MSLPVIFPYCPQLRSSATAAIVMAIVMIQPKVLETGPFTRSLIILGLLPISIIIKSKGGATIPFKTAV